MTNYNERLDKILDRVLSQETSREGGYAEYYADDTEYLESLPYGNHLANQGELKQAITSLTKELVAEAKPEPIRQQYDSGTRAIGYRDGYNQAIVDYRQNLLKQLEEL